MQRKRGWRNGTAGLVVLVAILAAAFLWQRRSADAPPSVTAAAPADPAAAAAAPRATQGAASGPVAVPSIATPVRDPADVPAPAPVPTGSSPASSDLTELVGRSNQGDGDASFALAGKIDRCRNIDRLLADAERVMQFKQSTHVTMSAGVGEDKPPSLDDMARRALDRVDAVRQECSTLGEVDASLSVADVLQRAIDQDNLQAKLCYLVQPDEYAPAPLSEAWHAWFARYREQAQTLVDDLVQAGVADGVLAAGLAYSGVRDLNGGPSYLSYALGEDPSRAAAYLLWQQRFAPGMRAPAFGRIFAELQARLGPAFAAAQAQADASPALRWLDFGADRESNCTLKLYVRAMEMQALGSF